MRKHAGSANGRIKRAMRRNNREVLKAVRRRNADGRLYRPTTTFCSTTWMNAIERLEMAGKIVYRDRRFGGGYALRSVNSRPMK